MKSLLILLAAAGFAALPGFGQTLGASASPSPAASAPPPAAAAPAVSPASTGPAASSVPLPGQPSGPALENNLPLIPEPVPAESGKSHKSKKDDEAGAKASPAGSPHDTFGVEQDIRTRIQMREAQTRAMSAPEIEAAWVTAHNTRTDPDRRAALTVYYNHLFDRMIQIDPTIATAVNLRREAILGRMHYGRLGDLLPAEDPYATPAPEAEGPNPPSTDEAAPF